MQHQEVKDKWVGGRYRQTVKLGYQCVARVVKYVEERGWTPLRRFGGVGAYQGWINDNGTFDVQSYQKVPNDPNIIPSQGDIIIFKPSKGNRYHGHIAIVDAADINHVTVIEQNAVEGNGDGEGGDEIRIYTYNYDGIVGRRHYKGNVTEVDNTSATDLLLIKQLVDNGIYNGQEGNGLSHRTVLAMAKMYNSILQLIKNK